MTLHADFAAAAAALPHLLPHQLTPWGMYLAADRIVQAVMIGLAIASIATWTVLLAKSIELARQGRALRHARAQLLAAVSLDAAAASDLPPGSPARMFVEAAQTELRLSADGAPAADTQPSGNTSAARLPAASPLAARQYDGVGADGIKERIASRLERIELAHARRLRIGTGVLATVGATAPFVGLFGTVWGIMNSFVGIAQANTTNLAVVAPGIAEALLATALGLVAAIPAVVIYNHFTRVLAGIRGITGDLSAAVQQVVSRDLDRALAIAARAGAPHADRTR